MTPISIFSGGLWFVPAILLAATITGFVYMRKELKSGTTWTSQTTGKKHYSDERPRVVSCWGFWVMAICGIALVITLLVMWGDK